tara:strand:- start:47075 stop:48181 length:1107 start_codon:yes stop_codon:yes gene_type:complete
MIINIETNKLETPMRNLSSVSDVKQTMPILGNTLFTVKDGSLELVASDLEVEIKYSMEIDVEGSVESTIPSKKFADILKSLGDAKTSLEFRDNNVIIKSGKSRFKVATLPADEFPLADTGNSNGLNVDASTLSDIITKTSFSMGYQDARHFLNGLYVEVIDNNLTAVATDGHRLALTIKPLESAIQTDACIIPRKCITELKKILTNYTDNKDNLVELSINSKNLVAKIGDYVITSKLIEGKYPDYNKVFPSEVPNILTLEKASFKAALQRMSILSSEQYKGVKLSFDESSLELSTTNPLQEKGEDTLDCSYNGEGMEVGFNLAYLLEVLEVIDTDNVRLCFGSPDSGCLVSSDTGTPDSKYIIMPMRV